MSYSLPGAGKEHLPQRHRDTRLHKRALGEPLCLGALRVRKRRHLNTLSAFASPEHVESDGGDQDPAFHDILREVRNIFERHAVIEARHKKRTEARAEEPWFCSAF